MEGSWVGAWGASPAFPNGPDMGGRTIRQVMRLSVGGSRLRIRLDNTLGRAPLLVNAATIALPGEAPGSIHPATVRRLTFGGRAHVLVQPGAAFISDALDGDVEALQRVCIDLYVARSTGITATHPLGQATTWISRAGDVTGQAVLPDSGVETARFFVSHIEVDAPGAFTLVALGDSITDGYGTTPDRDHRWPDILAERLVKAGRPVGIVNAGISSNRVLYDCPEGASGPSALARFDREVLAVPNVRVMTLLESINDIGHPGARGLHDQSASADDIIVGMSQLLDRAHTHGIRVVGGTLTPFAGTIFPGYYSPEGEAIRQAVNGWIRTKATFDAVVDFDSAVRDPVVPERLHEAFDLGDGLHLNDAGYRRMAEAINLSMLLP